MKLPKITQFLQISDLRGMHKDKRPNPWAAKIADGLFVSKGKVAQTCPGTVSNYVKQKPEILMVVSKYVKYQSQKL